MLDTSSEMQLGDLAFPAMIELAKVDTTSTKGAP
jgi:hypothetical protein